jgi:hypothetical protein
MSRQITNCSEPSCRAEIVFLRTATGALMPIDVATVGPDDTTYDAARHTSHYKTCKKPNRFSGSRKR